MIFLLQHLLSLGALVVVALLAGLPLARRLGCADLADRLVWGLVLGLLALAQGALLIAFLGLLNVWLLVLMILACTFWGAADFLDLLRRSAGAWRARSQRSRAWLAGGLAIAAAPFALSALYPPHAWDETIYHLMLARAFAVTGGLPFVAELRAPVFPPLAELLDAAVMLLADDISTHWIAWLSTLATGGLLVVWSKQRLARGAGWAAAALHLGTPIVVYLAGLAYVDSLLTLWVTAGLAAWQRARDSGSRAWLLTAGVCVGSAAAVKYLALFFIAWLALEVAISWPGDLRRRFTAAALLLVGVGGAALPSYARIVAWTHNPLFPFYPRLFGASSWSYEPVRPTGSESHLREALWLPLRSLIDRAHVGAMPPFSPFWLLALAVALVGAWRLPRWRATLAMAAGYLMVIPSNSRYLLPALPVVGLAGVATAFELVVPRIRASPAIPAGLGRRRLAVLCLILGLPGWLYAGWLCARRGPLPLDAAARQAFLEQRVPGYRAIAFLNRTRGSAYTAYGLTFETLSFHAQGRWLGDWTGPAAYGPIFDAFGNAAALVRQLRALGADVLVLRADAPPLPPGALAPGPLRLVYRDREASVYELLPER